MPLRIIAGPLVTAIYARSVCLFQVAEIGSVVAEHVLAIQVEDIYRFNQWPRPKGHLRPDELLVVGATTDGLVRVTLAVEAYTDGPVRGRFISCRSPRGFKVANLDVLRPLRPTLSLVAP